MTIILTNIHYYPEKCWTYYHKSQQFKRASNMPHWGYPQYRFISTSWPMVLPLHLDAAWCNVWPMCSLCWRLCHRQCNGGRGQDGSQRGVQRSVLPQKVFHRWGNKTCQIHAFPQASGSGHSDLKQILWEISLFYAFHMPAAEEMAFESGWAAKPGMLDRSRWCCAPEQAHR